MIRIERALFGSSAPHVSNFERPHCLLLFYLDLTDNFRKMLRGRNIPISAAARTVSMPVEGSGTGIASNWNIRSPVVGVNSVQDNPLGPLEVRLVTVPLPVLTVPLVVAHAYAASAEPSLPSTKKESVLAANVIEADGCKATF
jgi:hypothetical protein